MDKNKYDIIRLRMERCAQSLRKNNIFCECADNCEEALDIISSIIKPGDTIGAGGSVTLFESGVIALLRSGAYNFLDRNKDGLSAEDIDEIFIKSFSADHYFASANAITEKGEIYNVDGRGNRVAPMIFGPESVIIVAGYNKIVRDLDEAKMRVCEIAAPANAQRLSKNTPCTQIGKCTNCQSDDRICSSYVVLSRQMTKFKDRIKVILVGEELGY